MAGSVFAGYAYLGQHTGVLVIMAGILVTAWGLGSATRATYRYRGTEKPARRFADRVAAILLIVLLGLAILGWGTSQNVRAICCRCVRCSSEERGYAMARIPLELSLTPRALQRASTQARCFFRPHRDGDGNQRPCGRFRGDPGNENWRPASRGIQRVW